MSSLCCAFKRSQDYSSSQHDSIDDDTTTASGKRNTDSPTITSSRSHSRINGTLVYENDDVDLVDSFVQRGALYCRLLAQTINDKLVEQLVH
jgi:hypothetical protein